MPYEWDGQKNETNFKKHGIRFEEAVEIFSGAVLTVVDTRANYGEVRKISIGEITGIIMIVVVHTDRGGKKRIISARQANRKERVKYHEYLKDIEKKGGRA